MAKEKYYVVLVGRRPGIYRTWDDARLEVEGFSGGRHRAFKNWREAVSYWESYNGGTSAQLRPATETHAVHVAAQLDAVDNHRSWTSCIHQSTHGRVSRSTMTDDIAPSCGESFCGLLIGILVIFFALLIIIKF